MRRPHLSIIRGLRNFQFFRLIAVLLSFLLVEAPFGPLVAALAAPDAPALPGSSPATPTIIARSSGTRIPPDMGDAVWVAKDTVLKIAAHDGSRLLELAAVKNARAVAVDESRGLVWAFGQHTLHAYRVDGTPVHHVPVPPPGGNHKSNDDNDDDDDDDAHGHGHVALTVHPDHGTVWLGVNQTLYHFTTDGVVLHTLPLPHPIQALALDRRLSRVWVGTQKQVSAYDEAGTLVRRLSLDKHATVKDLALRDATSSELWVALKDTLRRYAANGTVLRDLRLPRLERLGSDGQGNLWVATDKRLLLLNIEGKVLRQLDQFGGEQRIVALVADPGDLSVWVASHKKLWHISADGRFLRTVDFHHGPPIRDLALSVDTTPPVLIFTAPSAGAVLNTRTPDLALRYSDVGQGIDPQTLRMQANGTPLGVHCTHRDTGAQCLPSTALPFGLVTLTAIPCTSSGRSVCGRERAQPSSGMPPRQRRRLWRMCPGPIASS